MPEQICEYGRVSGVVPRDGQFKISQNYKISSFYLKLFRTIMKFPFLLLGKESWHTFDQRFFAYYLDNTAATAIVPYAKVILDNGGARNHLSWQVKKYLFEKGININKHKFT